MRNIVYDRYDDFDSNKPPIRMVEVVHTEDHGRDCEIAGNNGVIVDNDAILSYDPDTDTVNEWSHEHKRWIDSGIDWDNVDGEMQRIGSEED